MDKTTPIHAHGSFLSQQIDIKPKSAFRTLKAHHDHWKNEAQMLCNRVRKQNDKIAQQQAALKALVEVVERIKFQKSPLHGGLLVSKHHGAELYFADTLVLVEKALALAQEVGKS